jgi:hypothetical protein
MKLEHVLARWVREGSRSSAGKDYAAVAGRWTNDHGSVVELRVDGDRLSGTFTAGGPGQPMAGPVTGWVNGDIVAFSVRWPRATRSLMTWVGQVVDDKGAPALKTLWHLVTDIPDEDEELALWATVHTGADTFR